MTEWRETTLGDVADVQVGFAFKSAGFSNDSTDVRLLRGVNIAQGVLDWDRSAYWPSGEWVEPQYQLADGDVVLAMDRPWIEAGLKRARIRTSDLPAHLVQRVARLRGTLHVRTSFIHHLLATDRFSQYLQGIVTGATVPHISQTQIEGFRLLLPPVKAQDSICDVLDSIDDLIENNRRRVEVLEEMARAVYREWFVRFRFPGHEDATFVDSPLGPIPEGWEVRPVSELSASVSRGIAPKYADDGKWTVLNQKCIRNERVSLEKARLQERDVPVHKQVQFGDILINSTGVGTLGRVAMYLGNDSDLTADSHVTIVRPSDPMLNPWFGMALIARRPDFEALGAGSTGQTELSRHDVGALPLLRPTDGILEQFAHRTWPLLDACPALLSESARLAAIRDLVLPRLVTGRIDVSSLDLDALVEGAVA